MNGKPFFTKGTHMFMQQFNHETICAFSKLNNYNFFQARKKDGMYATYTLEDCDLFTVNISHFLAPFVEKGTHVKQLCDLLEIEDRSLDAIERKIMDMIIAANCVTRSEVQDRTIIEYQSCKFSGTMLEPSMEYGFIAPQENILSLIYIRKELNKCRAMFDNEYVCDYKIDLENDEITRIFRKPACFPNFFAEKLCKDNKE